MLAGEHTTSYASSSPDGSRLAYVKWLDGGENGEIYVLGMASGVETRLTENEVFDGYPVWGPDGREILYSSRSGPTGDDFDLYLVGAEGGQPRRLTDGEASDVRADWSAATGKIVFNRIQDSGVEIVTLEPPDS